MQVKLLQPEPYKIASAEEDWLPPLLHRKFLTARREKEAQDRRETIATEREAKAAEERDKTAARPVREERGATTGTNGSNDDAGQDDRRRPAYRGGAAGGGGRGGMEMGEAHLAILRERRRPSRTGHRSATGVLSRRRLSRKRSPSRW